MPLLMGEAVEEMGFHLVQVHTVLRALGARKGRNNVVEVQLEHGGVGFLLRPFIAPQALCLGVGFNAGHGSILASRQSEVVKGALVHREETAGGTVFGRHVGDGRSVSEGKGLHARTKEFDELADHAVLAKHLHDTKGHVGRSHAGLEATGQTNTDHVRSEHVDGLPQHHGLGFNATHSPTKDAETVDHGGVGIGADQGVGQPNPVLLTSHAGEELKVDLVNDAAGRRDGLEIGQRLLAPLEEGVALHVSVVFDVEVHVERIAARTGNVHLHRVVDDQINRHLRVDLLGVAAHFHHGVAQRSQVNHGRHAGEILKNHAGGSEGDLPSLPVGRPRGDLSNVVLRDEETVVASQGALQQDADGIRQMRRGDAVGVKGV